MTKARTLCLALVIGARAGVWPPAASAATHHGTTTCRGGNINAGTYGALRITGFCTLPDSGNVTVRHGVVVTRTGIFNAATPAKLVVWGNVTVRHRGIAAIGCSPDVGCAELGGD